MSNTTLTENALAVGVNTSGAALSESGPGVGSVGKLLGLDESVVELAGGVVVGVVGDVASLEVVWPGDVGPGGGGVGPGLTSE